MVYFISIVLNIVSVLWHCIGNFAICNKLPVYDISLWYLKCKREFQWHNIFFARCCLWLWMFTVGCCLWVCSVCEMSEQQPLDINSLLELEESLQLVTQSQCKPCALSCILPFFTCSRMPHSALHSIWVSSVRMKSYKLLSKNWYAGCPFEE